MTPGTGKQDRSSASPTHSASTEVAVVNPRLAEVLGGIKEAVKAHSGATLCWQEYQSSIILAGRFCAAAMQMSVITGGRVEAGANQEIEQKSDLFIKNLQAALSIMQEVADRTYDSKWSCGRGHEEANVRLLGAGEIAVAFAVTKREIKDPKALLGKVLEGYRYVTEKTRSQHVAEEHWAALVAGASIGAGHFLLENPQGK